MGLRDDLQVPQEEKYNVGTLTPSPARLPRRGLHLHSSSVFVITVRRRTEEAPGAGWPKGQGRVTVREKSVGPKRGRGRGHVGIRRERGGPTWKAHGSIRAQYRQR